MNEITHCPDCTNQLVNHVEQCPCGWKNLVINKSTRYRCNFIENKCRCVNEGTMSNQVRGDVWYCHEHYGK